MYVPVLGGCPHLSLVTGLIYLLSPLSSKTMTKASGSDLEPDPWCWFLGLLLLGKVLGKPLGLPLVWVHVLWDVEQGLDVRVVVVVARDQEQPRGHLLGLRDHHEVLVLGSG